MVRLFAYRGSSFSSGQGSRVVESRGSSISAVRKSHC